MSHGSFAAAINCMDGRTQLPVIEWMKREYRVDYVDSITEPGPVRILAESKDAAAMESIRRRVDISVTRHGSRQVAIVAHADCAGNPVDKEHQLHQLRSAESTVLSWGMGVTVDLLWVGADWQAEKVG
jgi:hypothetical protein